MKIDESLILDLPDAPDFISEHPQLTATEIINLCEPLLPYRNELRYFEPEPEFVGKAFRLID